MTGGSGRRTGPPAVGLMVDAKADPFQRAANEDEGVVKATPGSFMVLDEAEGVVGVD